MFLAKISKLYKERIWHLTIPMTGGEFYMRGRGRWSMVTCKTVGNSLNHL